MPTLKEPFTEENFREIERGIELAKELEVAIGRAERTGLPTDKRLEEVREKRAQLQRVLNEYGSRQV